MDASFKIVMAHGVVVLSTAAYLLYLLAALLGFFGFFAWLLLVFAALAILGSLFVTGLAAGGAFLIGGEGGAEPRLPPEWVAMAPLALNSLCFVSLVEGGFSHFLLFGASFALLFLTVRPKFPPPSMTSGVIAGFAAFVVVLLLSFFMQLFGVEIELLQLLGLAPVMDAEKGMQFYGWYMLLVVAVAEEMWRAATYYNLLPAVGARAAAALATYWFIWMHLPGRILYGPLAAYILLLIGVGTLIMWYLCRGDYWGMTVAHAVYNTAVASLGTGLFLVEFALLGFLLFALWTERRKTKIEIATALPVEVKARG